MLVYHLLIIFQGGALAELFLYLFLI